MVLFDLGPESHVLAGLPLVLRLPHQPGLFPGVTVLEVTMEPAGAAEGRPVWRQTGTRELPEPNAAA